MGVFKHIYHWLKGGSRVFAHKSPYALHTESLRMKSQTTENQDLKEIIDSIVELSEKMIELDRRMTELASSVRKISPPMEQGFRSSQRIPAFTNPRAVSKPKHGSQVPALEYLRLFQQESQKLIDCLTDTKNDGARILKSKVNDKIDEFNAKLRHLDRFNKGALFAYRDLDQSVRKKVPINDIALHFLHLAELDLQNADQTRSESLDQALKRFAAFMKLGIIKPVKGGNFDDALHQISKLKSGNESMRGKVVETRFWGYRLEHNGQCVKKAIVDIWD